jgi:hypothetical protein
MYEKQNFLTGNLHRQINPVSIMHKEWEAIQWEIMKIIFNNFSIKEMRWRNPWISPAKPHGSAEYSLNTTSPKIKILSVVS